MFFLLCYLSSVRLEPAVEQEPAVRQEPDVRLEPAVKPEPAVNLKSTEQKLGKYQYNALVKDLIKFKI